MAHQHKPHRPLEGKNAIITGASHGIGKAAATHLATKGANLILVFTSDTSHDPTVEHAAHLEHTYNVNALAVQADVGTPHGPTHLIHTVLRRIASHDTHGFRIHIIVNNTNVVRMARLGSINVDEDFGDTFETNVAGPLRLIQVAMPYLPKDRSARIVNVSSTATSVGNEGQSVYAGSKAALEAMTRVWARELAEYGTVNSVNPGPTRTEMFEEVGDESKEAVRPWVENTPLAALSDVNGHQVKHDWSDMHGRPTYSEEVAGVIGMLCLPESGWCTGCSVGANGGMVFTK